jgi:hypothetical protein
MGSSRQCDIEHTQTGKQYTVSIKDLKWADPVSELLNNSEIDVFPGKSKMFFHSKDLPNLNWPAMHDYPMEEEYRQKLEEVVRDRSKDNEMQVESVPSDPSTDPKQQGEGSTASRPKRTRKTPSRFDNCIMAAMGTEMELRNTEFTKTNAH